ncbi:hypothetical protein DFH08DRAFT_695073, partial [Mycena albidolilacea]
KIEYLPPYSPHFQPVEQAFSTIKLYLRCIGISTLPASAVYYKLYKAFQIITLEMTWGFWHHCDLI